MAYTLAQLLPKFGQRMQVLGLFIGGISESKTYDGKTKQTNKLHIMCGTSLAKIGYDPESYGRLPEPNSVVEVFCECGTMNDQIFLNKPGKMRVILLPDGSEPAKP